MKQGIWKKNYDNGNVKYEGNFIDNNPVGIFNYYYKTGELKLTKEFFHNGKAAATHIYYKDGKLKASGLYVEQLKDSTWNYLNKDSILVMREQYKEGVLYGKTETYYYDGSIYEIKKIKIHLFIKQK